MNKFWEKVEHYNSKLIPPAIIALLFVIVYELFLHIENHTLEVIVHALDIFIIAVFIVDIIFLALKSKNAKYFFKHYWLDIIAIFPFVIFFNVVGSLYKAVLATERFVVGQAILHQSVETSKFMRVMARSSSKVGRILRIIARSIRVVTKSRLFTKIKKHKKTPSKKKPKKVKKKFRKPKKK